MTYNQSRLTAYALLSSLEEDLRALAISHLSNSARPIDLLGEEQYATCLSRLEQEWSADADPKFETLVEYLDFAVLTDLLNQHKRYLSKEVAALLGERASDFQKLGPIRNRVMHGRPMQFEDLVFIHDVFDRLGKPGQSYFPRAVAALHRINQDPSSVVGLNIPGDFSESGGRRHNLPTPDFDETGFIGRRDVVATLTQLCFGPFPVITVVGEGGMGKTALALKVAYDILDSDKSNFDLVVWTSCKTTMLTANDIVNIDNSIRDSLGMFRDITSQLVPGSIPVDDPTEEVLTYLKEFRILLVIDNLETVLDQRIKEFIARTPQGSKILITSRIGLGAYEYPLKLNKMTDGDAVDLLRALAKIRGVQRLSKMPNSELTKYCARMQFNPGWIKWFVAAAQTGKRPEEILANPNKFLEFCMSNVYEYLSSDSKKVLEILISISGPQSQADLVYLTDLNLQPLQRAIQQLLSTNMVNMLSVPTGVTYQSLYELSEMARAYIRHHHPTGESTLVTLNRKRNMLNSAADRMLGAESTNPYEVNSIKMRSKGDLVPAKILRDALELSKQGTWNFEKALSRAQAAGDLAPDYYEVYRVQAFIYSLQKKFALVKIAYENAIDLEPKSPVLRLFYGGCLLRIGDTQGALSQFLEAEKLDPKQARIGVELARAFLYLHQFDKAREKIDEVLSRKGISSRVRTLLRDLLLQWSHRRASVHIQGHEYLEAEKALFELKEMFLSIPANELDGKLRTRLMAGAILLPTCIGHSSELSHKRELVALYLWFQENSGMPPSVVTKIDLNLETATVATVGGAEVTFQREALLEQDHWARLKVGSYVFHESFGRDSKRIFGVVLAR